MIQVLRNGQITLPAQIRALLNIDIGDYLEPKIQRNTIVLMPKKIVDSDQSWYWSKKWQKMEREADEDIAKGNLIGPFDNVEDFLKDLKK